MSLIEILAIVFSVIVVTSNIGVFIYRKYKHLPTGECRYCSSGVDKLVKEYHKMYKNKSN